MSFFLRRNKSPFLERKFSLGVKIIWNQTGEKCMEFWKINGFHSRTDGPALTLYYDNGQISAEFWFLNGKFHRLITEGPALTSYGRQGEIERCIYYEYG